MAKRLSKEKNPDERPSKIHKSFRRSYREDYEHDAKVPGIMTHIFETFKILLKNWKTFILLLLVVVLANIILVGLLSENSYLELKSAAEESGTSLANGDISSLAKAGLTLISVSVTGGLNSEMSEVQVVFAVFIFLIIWLTTIYLLRHHLAKKKIKLRDALYNSMTPLISTFLVVAVIFVQCIPIMIFIVVYSAALQTDFLSTPFYALVFFIFAALMLLLSGYLLASSIIALVAVTAPGLRPVRALNVASDLMAGRRMHFVLRLLALVVVIAIMWVIIMLPLILFDTWMKTFEWTADIPFISICLMIMTCFTEIYATAYIYLYYRMLLDNEKK